MALKPDFVRLPTHLEAQRSARSIKERFGLPGFAYGIDGVHMKFQEMPRGVEGDVEQAQFLNRKVLYSLNCMVIGDAFHRILDVDCRWPGSVHDARIWEDSNIQKHLAARPFYLAGDAGYPLSPTLIKPYANPVGQRQQLFNIRLSGARTVMTENIYGIWKRRFPMLTNMRFHHKKAMKCILATAVLHNFALDQRDMEDFDELPPCDDLPDVAVVDNRTVNDKPAAGEQARENILLKMQVRRRRI